MKQRKQLDFTIPLIAFIILIAILASSCTSSRNYQTSPCWKGAEPRHRYGKMRAAIEVPKQLINTGYVCPDCGEWGCIYENIDTIYDGKDLDILGAIQYVCKERGISDPKIIDLLKANYNI